MSTISSSSAQLTQAQIQYMQMNQYNSQPANANNEETKELPAPMTKTLPLTKDSAKTDFFKNFVVESVDNQGRTSMRQIVSTDNQGRPSVLNSNGAAADFDPQSSGGGSGANLKFVRKSELSQDMFCNRSVISINQNKEVSYKYGASEQAAAKIAAQINLSLTVPPQKKPIFEMN